MFARSLRLRAARLCTSAAVGTLSSRILGKVDGGLLPTAALSKTREGYGSGAICSACDEPIGPPQVEYEFDDEARGRLRFHIGCYGLWDAACRYRGFRRAD
jgi:hypothetical protein